MGQSCERKKCKLRHSYISHTGMGVMGGTSRRAATGSDVLSSHALYLCPLLSSPTKSSLVAKFT